MIAGEGILRQALRVAAAYWSDYETHKAQAALAAICLDAQRYRARRAFFTPPSLVGYDESSDALIRGQLIRDAADGDPGEAGEADVLRAHHRTSPAARPMTHDEDLLINCIPTMISEPERLAILRILEDARRWRAQAAAKPEPPPSTER